MKINKVYIDEAVRIRKEYLKNLEEILKEETNISDNRENITNIKEEMQDIVLNSEKSDISKKLILNNKLNDIEDEIEKIKKKILPFYNKIEQLRVEADRLFVSITEKYPGITPDEIKKQIGTFL